MTLHLFCSGRVAPVVHDRILTSLRTNLSARRPVGLAPSLASVSSQAVVIGRVSSSRPHATMRADRPATASTSTWTAYMELPSEIAYLDVEVPGAPLVLAEPASDPERLRSCAGAIAVPPVAG